jgi:serine protease Do
MSMRIGRSAVALVALAGVASGAWVIRGHEQQTRDPVQQQAPAVAATSTAATPVAGLPPACSSAESGPEALSHAFRCAAQRALPGVVYVQVQERRQVASNDNPFSGTPFEQFFQMPQGQQRSMPVMGSGSGFVFRPGGYILTNNHVVDGADKVTVITQDRREMPAKVVGRDPNTDVAVIQVDAKNLPVLPMGNSDAMAVGDWVVALGYPLQLGATVTSGIVSAKGREIGILNQDNQANAALEHYIQTDAAINPGNSGGPLVDLDGEVIGINSAIASPTGYYSGYGFAVPINLALRVADDLIKFGEVHRPRLGLGVKDATPADVEAYKLPSASGAVVSEIPDQSPAADAGVELGDVIVAVDGTPVATAGDLTELTARKEPGQTVKLDIIRYGKQRSISVKLGEFQPAATSGKSERATPDDAMAWGFRAQPITPDLARQLQTELKSGLVVTEVDPMSNAARAGLRPGMGLDRVNGEPVTTTQDLQKAMKDIGSDHVVSLIVRLDDGSRQILNFRTGD